MTYAFRYFNVPKNACSCRIRTGRVRELARSSRSKVKMIWHQFSTVQFPNHHFVWKVCSVRFVVRGPSASVQFSSFISFYEFFRPWLGLTWLDRLGPIQSVESPIVWERQRSSSWFPPVEILARRPGFAAWVEGWCTSLAVLACLVCGVLSGWRSFISKLFYKFVQFCSPAWSG